MTEKKRTLWPLGILLVIALGIVLIVISIRISSKQSIDTDRTFNLKRIELDEKINAIMQQQNAFESLYNVRISTIGDRMNAVIMKNPYYVTPVPRDTPEKEGLLQSKDNVITIYVEKKKDSNNIQDMPIESVGLEFVRLDQGEKEVSVLAIPMEESEENTYSTKTFSLPMQGYYQARFKINVKNATQDKEIPVYFYHWVFNKQDSHL
ncbi:hypothetical protein [Helicobacter bilis]|uniref:hypothetical protein n=1 Tax=Helicobacter bilis TaxID=37372 RepID=UPI00051DE733|nr:hypothetical protein [Helicobacter bilis]MCI7410760.1 hypothetical protein [Helicobacter bilis]MDD7296041.1 hypothetical protein [Helicobacter bilis]MDY4399406.1 hypothetical protein [Helicobacter bilis]TLE08187.1 hypothetical protein LS78_006260 [Helicobacter bilis]